MGVAASVVVASVITYGFERPLLRHGVRGVARMLTDRRAAPSAVLVR